MRYPDIDMSRFQSECSHKWCPHCYGSGVNVSTKLVGKLLKERRTESKITLRVLSQESGFSIPVISELENGMRKLTGEKAKALNDSINRIRERREAVLSKGLTGITPS